MKIKRTKHVSVEEVIDVEIPFFFKYKVGVFDITVAILGEDESIEITSENLESGIRHKKFMPSIPDDFENAVEITKEEFEAELLAKLESQKVELIKIIKP